MEEALVLYWTPEQAIHQQFQFTKDMFYNRYLSDVVINVSEIFYSCLQNSTSCLTIIHQFELQAIVKSPLAGDFMTTQCRQFLEDSCGIEIVPSYQVASKLSFYIIELSCNKSYRFKIIAHFDSC